MVIVIFIIMKADKKVFLALSLIALMGTFASCQTIKDTKTAKDTDTAVQNTEPMETAAEPKMTDGIKEKDYQGYTFTYLAHGNGLGIASRFADEMWVPEETGDVINDAVVQRNRLLADKLNISIAVEAVEDPQKTLRSTVLANDNAYDMAGDYKVSSVTMAAEGLVRDWNTLPIDYTQPWWSQGARSGLSVLDRQYLMSGSILISEIDDTLAMIYNKTIAETHDIEDIYSLVEDGQWTLDRFISICSEISGDLNGDGKMQAGDDLFGYIQDPNSMTYNWFFACDLLHGAIDDDGTYQFHFDAERTQNMFDMLSPFLKSSNVVSDLDLYEGLTYFKENKIFCYAIILRNLEMLRDMDLNFGVIPYPKMDAAQAQYITHVGGASPILTIPKTNIEDDERLSSILDAMAIASYEIMIPAYYETALKDKVVRDPQSTEMLDIILASRSYDLSYYCGVGVIQACSAPLRTGSNNVASTWAKHEKRYIKQIQKTIDKLLSGDT